MLQLDLPENRDESTSLSLITLDHDSIAGILLSETGKLVLKTMQSQIFNIMIGLEDPDYL